MFRHRVILFFVAIVVIVGIHNFASIAQSVGPPRLVVNQVGYLPQSPKTALLIGGDGDDPVQLVNLATDRVVFSVSASPPRLDRSSGDRLQTINFQAFERPGSYYLRLGRVRSVPFRIAKDVYQSPLITLLRSYYLQRCGVAVDDPVNGLYHPPCHLHDGAIAHNDSFHQAGDVLEVARCGRLRQVCGNNYR